MCRCYIITSYVEGNLLELLDNTKEDYVICVDHGYNLARKDSITPHLIIGDFDSMELSFETSALVIQLPVEKDETDTLAAVKHSINLGHKEIIIIGGMGGRLDHTLANIQCLAYGLHHGIRMELRDGRNVASIHFPSTLYVPAKTGYCLSMFSFSQTCEGLTTEGLKYPLSDYTLNHDFPIGISNEFTSREAVITFRKGRLLLILSKD